MKIPEGWQLVPVELSTEMRKAMDDAHGSHSMSYSTRQWEAALAVAPTPPAQEAEPLTLRERTLRDLAKNRIVAQEDAPVICQIRAIKQGKPFGPWTTVSRGFHDAMSGKGYEGRILYTRPYNSELRKAAEEIIREFDLSCRESACYGSVERIENLRTALNKGES